MRLGGWTKNVAPPKGSRPQGISEDELLRAHMPPREELIDRILRLAERNYELMIEVDRLERTVLTWRCQYRRARRLLARSEARRLA